MKPECFLKFSREMENSVKEKPPFVPAAWKTLLYTFNGRYEKIRTSVVRSR